jgi:hypothetical protein
VDECERRTGCRKAAVVVEEEKGGLRKMERRPGSGVFVVVVYGGEIGVGKFWLVKLFVRYLSSSRWLEMVWRGDQNMLQVVTDQPRTRKPQSETG